MSRRITAVLTNVIILCLAFSGLTAQDNTGNLYYAAEVKVKSGMIEEYETVVKEFVEACKKHDFPFDYYAYSIEGFRYVFIYRIKTYSDIEAIARAVGELSENIGESRLSEMYDREYKALDNTVFTTFRYVPGLSKTGNSSIMTDERIKHLNWSYIYVSNENDSKWRKLQEEWLALFNENNIDFNWEFYTGGIGMKLPVWIYVTGGESAVEYHKQLEKLREFLDKNAKHLYDREIPLIKDYKEVTGRLRPDLSYVRELR